MSLTKKEVTKKLLEDVAKEFNEVMKLEPAIKTGNGIKKDVLMKDVTEAAKELAPTDTLSEKTVEVLKALDIKVPGMKLQVVEEQEAEEKPATEEKSTEEATAENDKGKKKKLGKNEFVMRDIIDHPTASKEEVQEALVAAGLPRMAESMLDGWFKELGDVFAYLKETGKLVEEYAAKIA